MSYTRGRANRTGPALGDGNRIGATLGRRRDPDQLTSRTSLSLT